MSASPATAPPTRLLRADDEPGVYRFRVFYLRVNGRRSVVPDWRLHETMRRLKLLHMYAKLVNLDERRTLDFSATVHGSPLDVSVAAGTWQVRLGAALPAAAA